MPKPHAFVRVATAAKFARGLLTRLRGAGWNRSEIGAASWLKRGPRYWFAGQVRTVTGGADVMPLWVTSENAELEAVSGFVACPWPGVISVRAVHSVEWSVVPSGGGSVLSSTSTLVSVDLVSGAVPPAEVDASVRYYEDTITGDPVIISQQPQSVAVAVLAVLDARGRVAHLTSVSGTIAVNHGRGTVNLPPNRQLIEEAPPP